MVKIMDILEGLGASFKHPEEKGSQFYIYAGIFTILSQWYMEDAICIEHGLIFLDFCYYVG
jgi:hypothetical protein